jgi:hypothetical protein
LKSEKSDDAVTVQAGRKEGVRDLDPFVLNFNFAPLKVKGREHFKCFSITDAKPSVD